jgi:hypothetical protein
MLNVSCLGEIRFSQNGLPAKTAPGQNGKTAPSQNGPLVKTWK